MHIKTTLLLALLLLVAHFGFAQVTSGAMSGIVLDNENKSLAGAIVKAFHEPSGTVYGTATQDDGSFNLQNLRTGPYRVEIHFTGFETKIEKDILVRLGETYFLKTSMKAGGTELSEVVVKTDNPLINSQRTGASTNIGTTEINTLPTVNRNISDFTRLTPQGGPSFATSMGSSSSQFNDNSFGGRDGRYNNIQINGANFNNSFGLNSNLLPGGNAQPISLDAIEEIQVGFAPYDVRQTGFTGANINAITRSGTNEIHGSAYYFFKNQSFTGMKVGDYSVPNLGSTTKNTYGIRLGGPIIKNKLFYFVNVEHEESKAPGVTYVANRGGATGANVSSVPADSLDKLRSFLQSKYGYDPGAYENFANQAVNKNTKVLGRIDYNINDKNKLFVSYSYMKAQEPITQVNATSTGAGSRLTNNREGLTSMAYQNAFYGFDHKVWSVSGQLTSSITSRLSNDLFGTYSSVQDTRSTPGNQFPFVDIDLSATSTMSFGTELFSYKNDLTNKNLNIIDNVTYNYKHHSFLAGAAYEYLSFGNSFLPSGTGYYHYKSLSDFMNGKGPIAFAYTYPFADQGGNTYVKANFGQASIYLQDKYNVTRDLTLTAGVRVEQPMYTYQLLDNKYIDTVKVFDKNGNLTTYQSDKWPKAKPVVSPRIGVNYDVLGNRSLILRGGTGIFAGKVPFVWFTNQAGGTGTLINTKTFALTNKSKSDSAFLNNMQFSKDPSNVSESNGSLFPQKAGQTVPSSVAIVSPEFKMPRIWRTNIGVDAKLLYGFVGTAEFIYTKDLVNVYMRNAALPNAQTTLSNGADNRPYWTSTKPGGSPVNSYYVLENSNMGESYNFSIGIARPARKGWYGSLYYTVSASQELSSNPGSQASSAWNSLANTSSPNEQVLSYSEYLTPHRIVASASYRIEYLKHLATTISLYYEGASLGRFNYTYASDINGDGVNADLLYIPNNASELKWADIKDASGKVVYTAQQQADAFNAYVDQDKYLSAHKGSYAKRYGAKYPFYNRFDLKFIQDIFNDFGKRRGSLQFTADIFNIGNLLNPSWGAQQRLAVGSGNTSSILKVATPGNATTQPTYQLATAVDNDGKTVLPTKTFYDYVGTLSTWSMQLGFRLTF